MRYDVITLTQGQPRYRDLLGQIRADRELVERMWADAESRPSELDKPGTYWTVVTEQGMPVAWAAARIITEDGALVLQGMCNYEHPEHRGWGLYELAYRQRHQDVILPTGLPAVTYLYEQPIPLHEADGWYKTGLADTSREPGIEPHNWWQLRRDPSRSDEA